jgi:hypothetical protein
VSAVQPLGNVLVVGLVDVVTVVVTGEASGSHRARATTARS